MSPMITVERTTADGKDTESVDVFVCSFCGEEAIASWPHEHCWRCGHREPRPDLPSYEHADTPAQISARESDRAVPTLMETYNAEKARQDSAASGALTTPPQTAWKPEAGEQTKEARDESVAISISNAVRDGKITNEQAAGYWREYHETGVAPTIDTGSS